MIVRKGFTVVEIIVVIVVIGILAATTTLGYREWQRNTADSVVKSDVMSGVASLQSFQNFKNNFPPNLAGTNFAASKDVALVLYTDAPSIGAYQNLNQHQNAQLLLNVCNANLGDTNNTACVFSGKGGGAKIHVKGTAASNTHWRSEINESDIILPGSDPSIAQRIIAQFKAQGGSFPVVIVSDDNTTLPEPNKIPNGPALRYCLEGRSGLYDNIVYHSTEKDTDLKPGSCPEDPDLHYYK